jgi:two-component system sensor histidine kinase BaeS
VGQRGVAVVGVQPVAAVDAATNRLLQRIGLALVAGLVVAVGLGLLIGRRASASVRDAAARAHRLADGERGIAPASSSITEIHEMSQALATLDQALATSEARQREFLLSISHELRTPLTALRGYAEALRDSAIPADQTASVGATLTAETRRLEQFITDLLSLARLEADDFRLERTTVDLTDVLTQTCTAWQATADANDLTLELDTPAPGETFTGDARRIRQLLDGLVENAMRATPAGGRILLRGRTDGSTATLTVADTGRGLAPGDHERAFERGYLRDRYAAQRSVGTGLGLSIAHRLCERMGGTLEASPNDPTGTRMRVQLSAAEG